VNPVDRISIWCNLEEDSDDVNDSDEGVADCSPSLLLLNKDPVSPKFCEMSMVSNFVKLSSIFCKNPCSDSGVSTDVVSVDDSMTN